MTSLRLGEYEQFRSWSGQARQWGPDARSRMWFAGGVLDGLIALIDEHIAAPRPGRRSDTLPAAIGCVPWLTHHGIAERLASLGSCCIVVDKSCRYLAKPLAAATNWFPNILPGLRDRMPGGTPTILGPYSAEPQFMVGPVRAVGMSGESQKPLLHAKLLVLGWEMRREGDFGEEHHWFRPSSVWWGSANWTKLSSSHLEVGAWSDDPTLAREATDFLDTLIGFSEPLTSMALAPEADLVYVDYDDEAMREAAREFNWAELDEP